MPIEFEEDVGSAITDHLEKSKEKVGYDIAKRVRYHTYNHLSNEEWGEEIKQTMSSVISTGEYSEFYIDHPAAYLHEFGGSVQGLKKVQAETMAFDWTKEQSRKARQTMVSSANKEELVIVPGKRFVRSAMEKTKRELE